MPTVEIRPLDIEAIANKSKETIILDALKSILTAVSTFQNETTRSPALKELHDIVVGLQDALSESITKIEKSNIVNEKNVLKSAKRRISKPFEQLKRLYQGIGTSGVFTELDSLKKKQLNDLKDHINKLLPLLENPNAKNLDEIETRLNYVFNIIKNYKQSSILLPHLTNNSKMLISIKNVDEVIKILDISKLWAGVTKKFTMASIASKIKKEKSTMASMASKIKNNLKNKITKKT